MRNAQTSGLGAPLPRDLAIAEVEEIILSFNLKITAEGSLPMVASSKAESDFAIEVKREFPISGHES
ncbi:hypothetical protein VB780_24545 [Leptolyngbya sp. CCNP1308]|uniref:hypothetical protein n=1 Tax=Leptolyngbya sp. CCNP1308 TaxID=3110255 RepID=UPI002B21953D|nr:hypothetical protein [Leptolyngbya sp. CCNP1308]MEA5451769.1 hypothetical protein [Leptolyngbya sp. CCNP1308]